MWPHQPAGGGASGGGGGGSDTPLRLIPSGPYFVDPTGRLVRRLGITSFCLPKRYATGQVSEAQAWQRWVASMGLTEERIFTRVDWTGPPGSGVEPGWSYSEPACDQALRDAFALGLSLQVVAHTGPFGSLDDMVDHLRRVDDLCLRHPNARLEVWNEPQQNGGHDLVQRVLDRYTPQTPGWSIGAYDPTPYLQVVQTGTVAGTDVPILARNGGASGQSMDYHSPRKPEWSRCAKDAYEFGTGQGPNCPFSPGFTGPVLLSEPPQVEQTIRDAGVNGYWPDPAEDWRAYAAGCALFACGGTLHSNPTFQQCTVPTDPAILACVRGFVAGFADVPLQRYHGYNRGDPPSSNPGSRRYFRWGEDNVMYELCVRPYGFRAT